MTEETTVAEATPEAVEAQAPKKTPAKKKAAAGPKADPVITFQRDELARALNITQKATGGTLTPVQAGVLFEYKPGSVTLTGSDTQLAASVHLSAKVRSTGSFVLKGQLLAGMIRAADSDTVELSIGAETIKLTDGEFVGTLMKMSPEGFVRPEMPAAPVELDATLFGEALRRTVHAASTDTSRALLLAVNVTPTRFAATDSFRLGVADVSFKKLKHSANVPADALTLVARSLRGSEDNRIIVAIDAESSGFQHDGVTVVVRNAVGDYPDVDQLLKLAADPPTAMRVGREELTSALRRSMLVASGTTPVKFTVNKASLKIDAIDPETGKTAETIAADVSGETVTVSVNAQFFVEALNTFDDDEVTIAIRGGGKPLLITSGSKGNIQLVMPTAR